MVKPLELEIEVDNSPGSKNLNEVPEEEPQFEKELENEKAIEKAEEPTPNQIKVCCSFTHSLIRGILTQSCSAGAKNFTKCAFYHVVLS